MPRKTRRSPTDLLRRNAQEGAPGRRPKPGGRKRANKGEVYATIPGLFRVQPSSDWVHVLVFFRVSSSVDQLDGRLLPAARRLRYGWMIERAVWCGTGVLSGTSAQGSQGVCNDRGAPGPPAAALSGRKERGYMGCGQETKRRCEYNGERKKPRYMRPC